jgi:hypothetical protein
MFILIENFFAVLLRTIMRVCGGDVDRRRRRRDTRSTAWEEWSREVVAAAQREMGGLPLAVQTL